MLLRILDQLLLLGVRIYPLQIAVVTPLPPYLRVTPAMAVANKSGESGQP